MEPIRYLDFDLLVEHTDDRYRSRVLNSPAGQAQAIFELDPQLLDQIPLAVVDAKLLGQELFERVFDGEVQSCLRRSQDQAQREGAGLRIRLRLTDVPELSGLAWEYLYDPALNQFLALSAETPLIRYLDLPERVQPLAIEPPLKILVVVSAPIDYEPLDTDREWETLVDSLHVLIEKRLVELERLGEASPTALQRALRQGQYHVFHFIGHGAFDPGSDDGVLVLEAEDGRGHPMRGEELGTLLHDHRSLRLAFLNACEGARASLSDPFAGVAQSLVQQGVPAVVAMQYKVSDRAAITLVREFYSALADGLAVDADLAEARKAVFALGDTVEWGTPVLYMRSPDGQVFDRTALAAPPDQVSAGLTALTDLMREPEVRESVITFRTDFEAACEQVNVLGDYKLLHDLLHTMQYHCYQPIQQESRRFPDDDLAIDNLMDYELTLGSIVNDLNEISARSSLAALNVSWVHDLAQAHEALQQALEDLDVTLLKRAMWGMGRILSVQPSMINTRLNEAARAFRLPTLIEALTAIRDSVARLELDPDKVEQFQGGVEALVGLEHELEMLVAEHDQWQVVDLELRRIEAGIRQDTVELEMSWPGLSAMVEPLSKDKDEAWAGSLAEDADALAGAIDDQNPAKIKRYFRRYRRQASDRFYRVDVDLKTLCEGLRQVGEPLTQVMTMMG